MDNDCEGVQHDTYESEERGHGRKETRSYLILSNPEGIRQAESWAKLTVIGMCRKEGTAGTKATEEVHYFIGSRAMTARDYGEATRNHWSTENNLHWQLDVLFKEDASRVQRRHGAENLALVRRMALALLKRHPGNQSLACKRYAATLDTEFLEEILETGSNLGDG